MYSPLCTVAALELLILIPTNANATPCSSQHTPLQRGNCNENKFRPPIVSPPCISSPYDAPNGGASRFRAKRNGVVFEAIPRPHPTPTSPVASPSAGLLMPVTDK